MHVDDAAVIDVCAFRRCDSLRVELLDGGSQTAESIAAISERELGHDDESQQNKQNFAFSRNHSEVIRVRSSPPSPPHPHRDARLGTPVVGLLTRWRTALAFKID